MKHFSKAGRMVAFTPEDTFVCLFVCFGVDAAEASGTINKEML